MAFADSYRNTVHETSANLRPKTAAPTTYFLINRDAEPLDYESKYSLLAILLLQRHLAVFRKLNSSISLRPHQIKTSYTTIIREKVRAQQSRAEPETSSKDG